MFWVVASETTVTLALAMVRFADFAMMLLVDLKPPLAVVSEGQYLLAVGIFVIILYDERVWQFTVNLESSIKRLLGGVCERSVIAARDGDRQLVFVERIDELKALVGALLVLVGLELGDVDCAPSWDVAFRVLPTRGGCDILGLCNTVRMNKVHNVFPSFIWIEATGKIEETWFISASGLPLKLTCPHTWCLDVTEHRPPIIYHVPLVVNNNRTSSLH